jgi:hypothetical protein
VAKKKQKDPMQVHVRMPWPLHAALSTVAKDNGQTLNAEILKRLADSFTLSREKIMESVATNLSAMKRQQSMAAEEQTKIIEKTAEKLVEKFSGRLDAYAYFKKLSDQYGLDDPEKQKQFERKLLERFEKEAKEESTPPLIVTATASRISHDEEPKS